MPPLISECVSLIEIIQNKLYAFCADVKLLNMSMNLRKSTFMFIFSVFCLIESTFMFIFAITTMN